MSHDYTPLPDAIAQDLGVYAACVYGRVWRYCQIGSGACTAAVQTIADDLSISAPTVKRHLANLVAAGYLSRTGDGKDGRPNTYRQTAKWVMGGIGGGSERSTQVDQKDLPRAPGPDQRDLPTQIREIQGVDHRDPGGRSERSTRDNSSSSSSSTLHVLPEEGGSRTRPAPKPEPMRRAAAPSSPSSVIDPADEMQTAILESCGLDPDLTRRHILVEVADFAGRLKARKFSPDQIREAAAAWPECFPDRDPGDIEPPHPQQLAEWVARRRAAEAMRKAGSGKGTRAAVPGPGRRSAVAHHGLVPHIEY